MLVLSWVLSVRHVTVKWMFGYNLYTSQFTCLIYIACKDKPVKLWVKRKLKCFCGVMKQAIKYKRDESKMVREFSWNGFWIDLGIVSMTICSTHIFTHLNWFLDPDFFTSSSYTHIFSCHHFRTCMFPYVRYLSRILLFEFRKKTWIDIKKDCKPIFAFTSVPSAAAVVLKKNILTFLEQGCLTWLVLKSQTLKSWKAKKDLWVDLALFVTKFQITLAFARKKYIFFVYPLLFCYCLVGCVQEKIFTLVIQLFCSALF